MAAKTYNFINQDNMLRLRTDEANERQPRVARVGKVATGYMVRVYTNHRTEERTDENGGEPVQHTVYIADFIETVSDSLNALEVAKEALEKAIEEYDSSDNVNLFYLSDVPMWLDKATRVGLKMRLEAEKDQGIEATTLWWNGIGHALTVEDALAMLNQLELYASKCYDQTQHHQAVVKSLDNVDSVLRYDFTNGYPSKLKF